MQLLRVGLAILIAASVSGFLGFAVGGRRGFYEGYAVATYTEQVLNASLLVRTLKDFDRNQCQEGRGILEVLVDEAMLSDWRRQDAAPPQPFYAPAEAYEIALEKPLRLIAEYRRSHPHAWDQYKDGDEIGEDIRLAEEMIRQTVARYTEGEAAKTTHAP